MPEPICPNCHHGRYLSSHKGETLNVEMDYYHCDACQKNFSLEAIEDEATDSGSDSSVEQHNDSFESRVGEEGLRVSDVPAGHGDGSV